MFATRMSGAPGVPIALQELFLFEKQRVVTGQTGQMCLVRGRQDGRLLWLKYLSEVADSEGSGQIGTLHHEGEILAGLHHDNLLQLTSDHTAEAVPYLTFAYQGQQSLIEADWLRWQDMDRANLVAQFVSVVSYLHSLSPAVAHGALSLSSIWYLPATRWLHLLGFDLAKRSPSEGQLQQDREAVAMLAGQLLADSANDQAAGRAIAALEQWVQQGDAGLTELKNALKHQLLVLVTTDL